MLAPIGLVLVLALAIPGHNSLLVWQCNSDADCATVAGATCAQSVQLCRCPAGFTFSSDVTKCISESLYGESCSEDNQCSHMLTGSRCNGVCECADGFTYVRGRCRQLVDLHGSCSEEIDCYFGFDRESVVCAEQRCRCADGFYQRSDNICRRKSMNAGDACVVHQDCFEGVEESNDEGSNQCLNQVCQVRNIGVQTSLEIESHSRTAAIAPAPAAAAAATARVEFRDASTSYELASSPSTAAKSAMRQGSLEATRSTKDGELQVRFGDSCVLPNTECPGLSHSVCQLEQCKCQPGYYHVDGVCKAEIGEVADSPELCSGSGQNADTKKCVCGRNQFAHTNLRDCVYPGWGINNYCYDPSVCSPYGAAACPGPEVFPQLCHCKAHAEYNDTTQLCVPKTDLGSLCTDAAECEQRLHNSECQNQLCACKKNHIFQEGQCVASIEAACVTDAECAPANAQCAPQSSTCECKPGFQHANGKCLKEATEFEEECVENEQCVPLLGATGKCIDSQCRCEDHQQHSNGKCNDKKVLGETCTKSSECFVTIEPEHVVCRNAVCSCQFGTNKDMAKLVCRKSASRRPSAMKVITLILSASAVIITGAALHDAYS